MSGDNSASFSNKTAFGCIAKFDSLQDDRCIECTQFLKACTEVSCILDRLGTGFSPAKKDILGNVKRIEERQKSDPEKFTTLNAVIEDESKKMATKTKPSALVLSLVWLKRALEFLRDFIQGLSEEYHNNVEDQNLRPTVLKAYEGTLKPYHGKMSAFLFSNLCRLVPYRKDFINALITEKDATPEMVISDIDLYLPNFIDNIRLMEELLNEYGVKAGSEKD